MTETARDLLAHSDPEYRPLMLAVRAADEEFEKTGDAGTKTWLDDYFLPALAEHGLTVANAERISEAVALLDAVERLPKDEWWKISHALSQPDKYIYSVGITGYVANGDTLTAAILAALGEPIREYVDDIEHAVTGR